jgi:hypothetical protein
LEASDARKPAGWGLSLGPVPPLGLPFNPFDDVAVIGLGTPAFGEVAIGWGGDKRTGTTSLLVLLRWDDDCERDRLLLLLLLADAGAPGTIRLPPPTVGAGLANWVMGP